MTGCRRLGRSPDRGDAVALALGDARRDPTAIPPGLDLAVVNRDLMPPSKWTEDQIPVSCRQPPPHLRWP